jgi:hypothetical protein
MGNAPRVMPLKMDAPARRTCPYNTYPSHQRQADFVTLSYGVMT